MIKTNKNDLYKIYGDGKTEDNIYLATVKSKGLAYIVAESLKGLYTNVIIK